MPTCKSKKIVRRLVAALACWATPFIPVDQARAQGACVTDLSTATVTCSGGDIPGGFGTGIENGFTINVGANTNVEGINVQDATINNGSSIAPTGPGTLAILGNNITLNNGTGTVSGDSGISANSVNVTSNDGTITGLGASGIAIQGGTVNAANGTGTISGFLFGILGNTVTVTSNNGTIEAANSGGIAIDATRSAQVTNGSGTIRANGIGGIAIRAFDPNNPTISTSVTVSNGTGTIQANGGNDVTGAGGIAIAAQNVTVTGNDGTIEAHGPGGVAVAAGGGTATVANGTGTITGSQFAITGQHVFVTSNDGTIAGDPAINSANDATVTNGSGIITGVAKAISAQNVTINGNNGTISAIGTAIFANASTTVTNGAGLITGGDRGIDASSVIVTGNAGTIKAGLNAGHAINATNDATITNGSSGTISADVNFGIAVSASSINILANDGVIEATAQSGAAIAASNGATVNNGIGRISGSATGIDSGTVNVVSNAGIIEATGTGGFAINALTDATVTSNAGKIQATGSNGAAIRAGGLVKATNDPGGIISGTKIGVTGTTLDITNAAGATISGGITGITGSGSVINAGTISGGTNSVLFTGTGINTLTVQTGSTLNGEAAGSTATGATNNLVLQGHGTASNVFSNFNHLDVNADTSWVWDNASPTIGTTAVNSGTFVLNRALQTTLTVNNGGTLAGQGRVTGNVTVMGGGTVAPGAAAQFSTLSSGGIVAFQPSSTYRVNVNAAGQNDKFAVGGATLNGNGTVSVLAQNGTYAPSTRYTILTTVNPGLGNGNVFHDVTSNLAFLTPSLSYDANDVFLTLATNGGGGGGTTGGGTGNAGFGFAAVAQTRNQKAVATSLDAGSIGSPLIATVLNQTVSGALQAFDALSGEIFGSVHNVQTGQMQFARNAMLGRMRQASYYGAPGELGALSFGGPELAYAGGDVYAADFPAKAVPGKFPSAPPAPRGSSRDLTFWAQGLGGWGHADSDGNAASLKSRFGGFLSGADARLGDAWRAGLVAGYMRTDLNVTDRSSSAGIDSVQFGGYAGGTLGAFNVRGGASYSYDSIDTSRAILFPGFTDKANAHVHGNAGQVFGEVGYGMTFGPVAVEPLAGLAYVHVRDGSFAEAGGLAALSAASAHESTGYSTLGLRAATAVPLVNGTVLVPRGSLQWQHAFGDVTPVNALAFQSTGTSFTVAGIPIARNSALVEAGFDWRFNPQARLGAFYQGELAAHAASHAIKGAFTWDF